MTRARAFVATLSLLLGACSSTPADDGSGGRGGNAPSGGTGGSGGSGGSGAGGASAGNGTGNVGIGGAPGTSGAPGGGAPSGGAPSGGAPSGGTSGAGTTGGAPTGGGGASAGAAGGGSAGAPPCVVPPPVATPPASARDVVDGTLIQFNDNGAWSWYQDERAVVDVAGGKIIVGSDANDAGAGGAARDGLVEVVIYDINAKTSRKFDLIKLRPDDHNAPALLVRPDGKYLALYAGHNENCLSYFRTFDGTQWGTQGTFDWGPLGCPASDRAAATYSNLWYLSAEKKTYNFVRSVGTSPNLMVSSDLGQTWTYGGRLTSTPQVGYVAGYYKYWGNGVDRIDFVGTEAHPRDFNNNLYHGYVKGGKSYDSSNKVIDDNITDGTAPEITEFTRVFATNTMVNGIRMTRAWNIDIQSYADGSIAVLFKMRANESETDHRIFYARFDGSAWKTTYLSKGGAKLFSSEQDYIGLGALHPNDPYTIYISTPIDPRNDTTDLGVHEIFRGTTCDQGATFTWTPVTQKSTRDNLRPIVPSWDAKNTALLWWRGTYTKAQDYNAAVVGIVKTVP